MYNKNFIKKGARIKKFESGVYQEWEEEKRERNSFNAHPGFVFASNLLSKEQNGIRVEEREVENLITSRENEWIEREELEIRRKSFVNHFQREELSVYDWRCFWGWENDDEKKERNVSSPQYQSVSGRTVKYSRERKVRETIEEWREWMTSKERNW